MRRSEMLMLDISVIRQMGLKAGIPSKHKDTIIAALADDYRTPEQTDTMEPETIAIGGGQHVRNYGGIVVVDPVMDAPDPAYDPAAEGRRAVWADDQARNQAKDQAGESIIWPEVPMATCDVNGHYVSPPWESELETAISFGHVELMGPAGSGKTLAVHKLATVHNKRLAVITADGGLRKRDLIGQRELIDGQTIFQASEFAMAARQGDWALIDEANMAEADALGQLNSMLDRPGTEGSTFSVGGKAIAVHPDFRCFITRNPGYAGTKTMNEALRDRFWSIEVPPLLGESLNEMLRAHDVPVLYRPIAKAVIEALYSNWEQNKITYQISPRRALAASSMGKGLAKKGKLDDPLKQAMFWELLTKSILTKVDVRHQKDAIEQIIKQCRIGLSIADKQSKKEKN